jgi:hypothetical protein
MAVTETAVRQDSQRIVTRRILWAGRTFLVRFDCDDPGWRDRALASLDPDSDAAYAVRSVPPTAVERRAFAVWAESELSRITAGT